MCLEIVGESGNGLMVFAGCAEKQTLGIQIETESHVILASSGSRLVYSDAAHRRHVNLCASSSHIVVDDPPDPRVMLAQNGSRRIHRHLTNQGHYQGLE